MAALSKFFPYVLPYASGVPEPVAEHAIRAACIEFCNLSTLYRYVSTPDLEADLADYQVEVPSGSVLVKVVGVMVEDAWIQPASAVGTRSGVALRGAVGSAEVTQGTPKVYYQKTPTSDEISLYPVPDATIAAGLTVNAACAPSRAASTVPDFLFEDWAEEIADGALSRILAIKGQSFSDPAEAGARARSFYAAVTSAVSIARTGLIAASPRVQPKSFI